MTKTNRQLITEIATIYTIDQWIKIKWLALNSLTPSTNSKMKETLNYMVRTMQAKKHCLRFVFKLEYVKKLLTKLVKYACKSISVNVYLGGLQQIYYDMKKLCQYAFYTIKN